MKLRLIIIFVILAVPNAWAGSQSQAEPQHEPAEIIKFAKDVEKYAASKGARAFIIARMGRPEKDLPDGIMFTHTAIAVYSNITLNSGEVLQGYAIHNLYQTAGSPDKSELVVDYPVDFFWGAHELKAGIVIPDTQLQQKLIALIAAGNDQALHNPKYSVIANPFNSQFQNCTEYTLDLINAAIYDTLDIARLKANAAAHFSPQRVNTSRVKLMFGSMLMDDVTTKDHKGKVYTTTFTTIGKYLQKNQLADEFLTLNSKGEIQSL
ncbi:DUF2145 domain-containing protein [Aliiglaciecola litoralis]|uniref:DUF2145 domain-containing protein n=1 Tax=Aliiglaciecola litoralis TaxID=582857 RepID=A0ABN1LCJ7_9ALTE